MRHLLAMILLCAPMVVGAQSNWTAPVETVEKQTKVDDKRKNEKEAETVALSPYLAEDAVPLIDGKVKWTKEISAPGKSAKQLYDIMLQTLATITKEEKQLERSRIALVNENEHKIVATLQEWLVFSSTVLSLDRTQLSYVLLAECTDGKVTLSLDRISYAYPTQSGTENYLAEKWITDKYSVNKKRTRLLPISGKFRRKTIDRKNEVFATIEQAIR